MVSAVIVIAWIKMPKNNTNKLYMFICLGYLKHEEQLE